MNEQEQRIAVAEACGWRDCGIHNNPLDNEANWCSGIHPLINKLQSLPDYPNDLNAMHEAWLNLPFDQQARFARELRDTVRRDTKTPDEKVDWLFESFYCNATAQQRCEAFLRTIGKWKG